KIQILGINSIKGEKVFVLRFLQAKNPKLIDVPFFAKYDPKATWFDQLEPAFGEDKFKLLDDYLP
ncbi:MAG: lysine 2,3-aminomutase, partial [Mucinivorans sp.]